MIRKPERSTSTEVEKADRGTVKLKVKWGIRQKDREGHRERESCLGEVQIHESDSGFPMTD